DVSTDTKEPCAPAYEDYHGFHQNNDIGTT
ncbi:unnamed protein product, partial [marine sediment metagenome]